MRIHTHTHSLLLLPIIIVASAADEAWYWPKSGGLLRVTNDGSSTVLHASSFQYTYIMALDTPAMDSFQDMHTSQCVDELDTSLNWV